MWLIQSPTDHVISINSHIGQAVNINAYNNKQNTHTHTHMHALMHTHTHTHTHARMHARTHTHTHACMHTHKHTHTHALSLSHRGTRWLYLVERGWRSANSVVDFEVSQAVRPHATHQQLHNKDNHKFELKSFPLQKYQTKTITSFWHKSFTLQKPQHRQSQQVS